MGQSSLLPFSLFPNRNFSILNGNTWTSVFPEFNRATNQPSVQEQLEVSREFCESSDKCEALLLGEEKVFEYGDGATGVQVSV